MMHMTFISIFCAPGGQQADPREYDRFNILKLIWQILVGREWSSVSCPLFARRAILDRCLIVVVQMVPLNLLFNE